MSDAHLISVPKWGLTMEEGRIVAWHKQVGDLIAVGDEVVDIETTKITNTVEAQVAGRLRRILADPGMSLRCGAAIGVIATDDLPDDRIDALVAEHQVAASEAIDESLPPTDGATVRDIAIDGRTNRLRFLDLGVDGVPVVLIHGFGGDLENWMFNQPALATGRRTIAVDLPGHGGSDKSVGDGSAAYLAKSLAALLDEIGVGRWHLVSHSFGALVAREMWALRPESVETFTAIAPADLGQVNRDYLERFVGARRRSDMQGAAAMLFADPDLATRDLAENLLRYKRLDGVDAALRTLVAENFAQPIPDPRALALWSDFGERGLLIWGEADAIIPAEAADAVAERTNRLLISGAGHMPHLERADQVNAVIEAHLRKYAVP